MKAKQLFVISALAMVGFTACEKDLYDPNQKDKEVTDLIIPSNFDWQMTKATTCNVTSDHSAQLSIYLDEARTAGNLLATVSVQAGSNINLPLALLKETTNVYVEYQTADGKKAFITAPVNADGNISFAAPADSKIVTTRAKDDFGSRDGILFYPKGSGGTIMFEDNYPALGDYDFNDFVARYSAIIETVSVPSLREEDTYIKKLEFKMDVIAIGGVKSYIPSLRLPFSESTIDSAVADAAGDGVNSEIKLEQVVDKSSKKNVVFILNGAEKNQSKPLESQFLNTEKGSVVVQSTKRITLTVTFKDKQALLSDLTSNLFDIFLCKLDKSVEIHMLGYGPAFQNDGNNHETSNSFVYDPEKNDIYKFKGGGEGENLVWAISIPDDKVAYAYEKANFLKAYPTFATWAQSGGASAVDWYKNKTHINSAYLF